MGRLLRPNTKVSRKDATSQRIPFFLGGLAPWREINRSFIGNVLYAKIQRHTGLSKNHEKIK
jgi:hypothetical protein